MTGVDSAHAGDGGHLIESLRDRLTALIENWRQREQQYRHVRPHDQATAETLRGCAKELELMLMALCPDCEHGIAGGHPCKTCGGSGYAGVNSRHAGDRD